MPSVRSQNRTLRSDEVAILVVADQRKVEKVYDHHRNDNEEYRADEVDQQGSDDRIGQPQPPCLLQELCIAFHLSIQVGVFAVFTKLAARRSSRTGLQLPKNPRLNKTQAKQKKPG